jgi:hypothetical protein
MPALAPGQAPDADSLSAAPAGNGSSATIRQPHRRASRDTDYDAEISHAPHLPQANA